MSEDLLKSFQQALEICARSLGANHPNTVTVRENIEKLRAAIKNNIKQI